MNFKPRRLASCTDDQISAQWDAIAEARHLQLRSGRDLSFEHVLKPCIFGLISDCNRTSVLDAGCGSGVLTQELAQKCGHVFGIDVSPANIAIAVSEANSEQITYLCESIENLASNTSQKFSLVVANMVLQDTAHLEKVISSIATCCENGATLVATLTHPWFWPTYWGYDDAPWFNYQEEQAIEAPFRISTDTDPVGITVHFHRPLSQYIECLKKQGFDLIELKEPLPSKEVQAEYPSIWQFPRFLAVKCRLVRSQN